MKHIALAGNPNSGKSTLFNALTGSTAFVGNWPGVTVEKREGRMKLDGESISVMDLPGIYSLSPYSNEEIISRDYILQEHPDVVINIVDASNLERNLYLTTQLIELNVPVVVALNMMDVVRNKGEQLSSKALSQKLGCPVCEISAINKTGFPELKQAVKQLLQRPAAPNGEFHYAKDVEEALQALCADLDDGKKDAAFSVSSSSQGIRKCPRRSLRPPWKRPRLCGNRWRKHTTMRSTAFSRNSGTAGSNPSCPPSL